MDQPAETCLRCGAPLSADWHYPVCPGCMLLMALEVDEETPLENHDEPSERGSAVDEAKVRIEPVQPVDILGVYRLLPVL